jgi:hypothetical protein
MSLFVFVGPTLTREAAEDKLGAIYLPPAAQGDVLRVARERPFAIGIIDGYFERLPAVWHKEILWALSQGIHVLGAASMGALRAAELGKYGMKGVGAIYEAFAAGDLEDDDEVAVAHGDRDTLYRASSEAMVNIRATLQAAERTGILSGPARKRFESIAKGLFYPDRTYPSVLACAASAGVPLAEINAVRTFVRDHKVDQKRADAIACLEELDSLQRRGAPPRETTFSFSRTESWDRVVEWAEAQPPLTENAEGVSPDLVAAEARLAGPGMRELFATALVRALAEVLVPHVRLHDRADRMKGIDEELRAAHLANAPGEPFRGWLEAQALTAPTYAQFLGRAADVDWVREKFRGQVARHVVDELRSRGDLARFARRAQEKREMLSREGLAEMALPQAEVEVQQLLAWYFENRLGVPVPQNLEKFYSEMGIADESMLLREAQRERLFARGSEASLPRTYRSNAG